MRRLTWDKVLRGFAQYESNSPLWQVVDDSAAGNPCIAILGNTDVDHEHGKMLLLGAHPERAGYEWRDYALEAELRVAWSHLGSRGQAYPGIVVRARDPRNAECFFFRPHAPSEVAAAYVPIAHGLQPVWTQAYRDQTFGSCHLPRDGWFRVRAEVRGREAVLFVDGVEVLRRTLTYYLWHGRAGLYAGTGTDVLFRDVSVTEL